MVKLGSYEFEHDAASGAFGGPFWKRSAAFRTELLKNGPTLAHRVVWAYHLTTGRTGTSNERSELFSAIPANGRALADQGPTGRTGERTSWRDEYGSARRTSAHAFKQAGSTYWASGHRLIRQRLFSHPF